MAGLVPAIHVVGLRITSELLYGSHDVDGRDKPGHDVKCFVLHLQPHSAWRDTT